MTIINPCEINDNIFVSDIWELNGDIEIDGNIYLQPMREDGDIYLEVIIFKIHILFMLTHIQKCKYTWMTLSTF